MKQTLLLLLAASLAFAADDAKKSETTPQKIEIPAADALQIRTKQVLAQNAQAAYEKDLEIPEIAAARVAAESAGKALQQTAQQVAARVCGTGGRITEEKDETTGDPKLVCVAAAQSPKTAAPAASTPAKK